MTTDTLTTPLRVLCLEDNSADAELMQERLCADGFDVQMRTATDRAAYGDLLESWHYDVILADYSLPDFDAPSALRDARALGVSVPFICVSGMIGEEQAVELLKLGAADYVLKDRMGRLATSVRSALTSADQQAKTLLAQERFEQLFNHMADALILHDESVILANPAALRDFGYSQHDDIAGVAIDELIHPDSVAIAHSAYEQLRNGASCVGPFELKMVRRNCTEWFSEVIVSALASERGMVFESTLRNLTLRRQRADELERYRLQLEQLVEERGRSLALARSALFSVTAVVIRTVEIRDPYTAGHQRRVASLATAIARRMGLPEDEIEEISIAATMHDIGKISIPAEILSKPSKLSNAEFELIKSHAQAGYDIISSAELTGAIPEMVLQHHERCDGTGYPRGLREAELIQGAKIIMVADVVEAMSSHRPYRTALGIDVAREEIVAGAGIRYDLAVVEACEALLEQGFTFEGVAMA